MVMLILGGALLGIAAVMDTGFRLRMKRSGYKWAILQGGAFDYREYHKVRREHRWAAWPVYLMWLAVVCGIAFLIAGFFAHFGTSPKPL